MHRLWPAHARIIHQYVQPTEAVTREGDGACGGIVVRHIERQSGKVRIIAGSRCKSLQPLGTAPDPDDGNASAQHLKRRGQANAAAGAGDDGSAPYHLLWPTCLVKSSPQPG